MSPLRIELGWPSQDLSPNGRPHFHAKARAAKKAVEEAFWATRQAMGAQCGPTVTKLDHDGSKIRMTITAHPTPMTRNLDDDNFIARCKSHRDGIAKALGINDNLFAVQPLVVAAPVPNGRMIITIGGQS